MRVATETVWETAEGKLVPAGDKDAAILVAAKGHPVPDKKLEKFGKSVEKFFKDAKFDRAGQQVPAEQIKQPDPVTLSRLNTVKETKATAESDAEDAAENARSVEAKRAALSKAPKPANREDALPNLRTRGKKKK